MANQDKLCEACEKVDVFSLFIGPRLAFDDVYTDVLAIPVGTLQQVRDNSNCPLCRLMKHVLEESIDFEWDSSINGQKDPGKVRCYLEPYRVDRYEEARSVDHETKSLTATMVDVVTSALENIEPEEEDPTSSRRRTWGHGFQLLSPESVDPSRPLMNGFRATSIQENLSLLSKWVETCHQHHNMTCKPPSEVERPIGEALRIRLIDVSSRQLLEHNLTTVRYAALSYVWSEQARLDSGRESHPCSQENEDDESKMLVLPSTLPDIIEDALYVCKAISIPYLWVDQYCIHQDDPTRKAAEIESMGSIYRHAHITLVTAWPRVGKNVSKSHGLFKKPLSEDLGSTQRIEKIGGRQYISRLPAPGYRIVTSSWIERGWTFQEGQMGQRIAVFGAHDICFTCGAGSWRESLHSSIYGHDARLPGLDKGCYGFLLLSYRKWYRTKDWVFRDYKQIIDVYSGRNLSFESDILNAVSGSLNLLGQMKGVRFLHGLPSVDFHYALSWTGEYDRPRHGFPSWSWAGWHANSQAVYVFPKHAISSVLEKMEGGKHVFMSGIQTDIELEGDFLSPMSRKCSRTLASLAVNESEGTLALQSEVAKFFIDIIAADHHPPPTFPEEDLSLIPLEVDSTSGEFGIEWIPDNEYEYGGLNGRIRFRDSSDNTYGHHFRWWHYPSTAAIVGLPVTLRGSTLAWLLRDGIELIRIMDITVFDDLEEPGPSHRVLCLGIDRSAGIPGRARRMGFFYLSKDAWDAAGPEKAEVVFV